MRGRLLIKGRSLFADTVLEERTFANSRSLAFVIVC